MKEAEVNSSIASTSQTTPPELPSDQLLANKNPPSTRRPRKNKSLSPEAQKIVDLALREPEGLTAEQAIQWMIEEGGMTKREATQVVDHTC